MVKNSLAALVALVVAGLVGCGGNGLPTPPPGGAFIEEVGDQVRVRGQLAFTDAAGNPVDAPAGGAVVVIGGASLAAGTDRMGRFLILGLLPWMQGMPVRIGAPGFLPLYTTIPASATSLPEGTLELERDTNAADNPTISPEDPPIMIGLDGIVRFGGWIPEGTDVVAFPSSGSDLSSFEGAAGATLETEYFQGSGGNRPFRVTLPPDLPTGRTFVCGFDPMTGFVNVGIWMTINPGQPPDYNRPVPPGNHITCGVPGAASGFKVHVIVADDNNIGNNFSKDTTSGDVAGDLPGGPPVPGGTPPAVSVRVIFVWTDENGTVHHETYFGN